MPLFRLRLNLTARLMLAMMLVVVIVTSGMLWMMRQRVETSYLRLFEERFRSQIDTFSNLQTVRLESIRQRCRMLAASAAVVEALQLGTGALPDGVVQDLQAKARVVRDSATAFDARAQAEIRDSTDDSLITSSTTGANPNPANSGAAADNTGIPTRRTARSLTELQRRKLRAEPPDFVELALVSSLGQVYAVKSGAKSNTDSNADAAGEAEEPPVSPDGSGSTETGTATVHVPWLEAERISRVPTEQQTGYVLAPTEYSYRLPREVILTPVQDPSSGETLGALAVGLPFTNYGESSLYDLSRPGKPGTITNGLWLGDHLFTSTIPAADQDRLKDLIQQAIQDHQATHPHSPEPPDATSKQPSMSEEAPLSVRVELSGKPYQMMLRQLSTDSALSPAWGVMLSSLSGMVAEQQTLRNEVLASAGLALGAALLLSFFLSRGLMRPVQALVRGTRQIREGNYTARVRIRQTDEIGHLGESFNEMAAGLQQREQYHSILVQLSDYDVARRLIASPSLGGERRDVSVLFCDIRNFTAISGAMTPEDVISMLNEHMTALTESVHHHHGVVDKFVGDLIMAVFGAPENTGDHPGDAARCALSMMDRRRELNAITNHPVLEIGIGIASGICLAGCMGSENRLNYTVLGEHVNLAARLCSAAAPGETLIAPDTAERLGEMFTTVPCPPQTFKGFRHPIPPFRLTTRTRGMSQESQSGNDACLDSNSKPNGG